ncbi:hypothetical protein DHEL01_v209017 [Diaporthe helianthi]|uniref:Uncharacterized protein n=1 Tax=Diaporthe helianthi TaxID=158607 RepID=A0A2P5HQQ3_DIAHE|nr:hypothetical protein DHEL01_v209017 [Diaporthe helianthi]
MDKAVRLQPCCVVEPAANGSRYHPADGIRTPSNPRPPTGHTGQISGPLVGRLPNSALEHFISPPGLRGARRRFTVPLRTPFRPALLASLVRLAV